MTIIVATEIHQINDDTDSITVATQQNENIVRLSYYRDREHKEDERADAQIVLTHEFIRKIYRVFITPCP